MLFKHNEVLAGIKYVNSKNFVRGYLINPDDYDLYDDDGAVTESEA
jgi:hypothetical protein